MTTATKTDRKLQASYWRYDGNHHNGKDCKRHDPHGFGLSLISYLAYIAPHLAYVPGTEISLNSVKIVHHKGGSFGHEITVKAPKEVWEAAKVAYDAEQW